MKKLLAVFAATAALGLVTTTHAQVNLTAETASPSSAPGVSVIALSEAAAKYNVANMQVTTGQTLTNSVQNVAEGKSDVAAAPFVLPFLLSRAVGPYAKVGKEKGAELASNLAVLYTYRIACQGLYAFDSNNFPGYDGIKAWNTHAGTFRDFLYEGNLVDSTRWLSDMKRVSKYCIEGERGFVSNHRAGENYLSNVQKHLKELEWI